MNVDVLIADGSGSKDIFKRNTILVCGKPLVEYTLEAAFKTTCVRDVYLSTDDDELLNTYRGYKGINLIHRSKKPNSDGVSIKSMLVHALGNIRSTRPDLIVILLPGAVLISSKHIDEAVKFASSLPSFDSIISVVPERDFRFGRLVLDENKKVAHLVGDHGVGGTDNRLVFKPNRAIWVIRPDRIDKFDDILLSDNSYGFQMDESVSVCVDKPYDLAIAEAMFLFQQERFSWDARGGFNLQRLYVYDDPDMGIRRNVLDANAYERHFQRYKIFLDRIDTSDAILDIACGSGYGSQILASKARSVLGVDVDLKTIEYARRHHSCTNVTFEASSVETFTPVNRYDKIISVETIEHLANPDKFIERAKEWLNPAGELWLTCPLIQDGESNTESPFHISELTKEKLSQTMNRCLKDVKLFELNDGQLFCFRYS